MNPIPVGDSISRYVVETCLLQGSRLSVYRCADPLLERQVAVIIAKEGGGEVEPERLLYSQRILADLLHPNIVAVYDAGEWEGRGFAVLEYIDAGSIDQHIKSDVRVPWATTLRMGASLAGALTYLHARGVLNGGVKPLNIALRSTGEPVLLGFEHAKLFKLASATEYAERLVPDLQGLSGTLICLLTKTPWPEGGEEKRRSELLDLLSCNEPGLPDYVVEVLRRGAGGPGEEMYVDAARLGSALRAVAEQLDHEMGTERKLSLPIPGETVILHVERREEERPGAYREYQLLDHLSDGAFGDVYRAIDQQTNGVIALKILKSRWLTDHLAVERFRREASVMSELVHPNIVRVFNFGRYGETFFIAMEFVDGQTLAEITRNQAVDDIGEAVGYAREVLLGLAASAEMGVVHRDVKPSNIKVTEAGKVKLFDFGVARIESEEPLTQTGWFVGTVRYASPEQVLGKPATPASDVYAVGVMLFEFLTGVHPHPVSDKQDWMMAIASNPALDLASLRGGLPVSLVRCVKALLEKDPLRRPSAVEAVTMLDAALEETSTVLLPR